MIVWTDRDMLFAAGDIVRHTNGSAYRILTHCLRESDSVECYAYRDTRGGVAWVRPADEMEDGRFTLVVRADDPPMSEADEQKYTQALHRMRAKAEAADEMANLLREAINDFYHKDMVDVGWMRRAANALSRIQGAPETPATTDATPKNADAPTGRSGALGRQVGGDHYHRTAIQPWDIWEAYDLDPWEANALKYLLRRKPGVDRATDLSKAAHYVERCIERAQEAACDPLECD